MGLELLEEWSLCNRIWLFSKGVALEWHWNGFSVESLGETEGDSEVAPKVCSHQQGKQSLPNTKKGREENHMSHMFSIIFDYD